MKKLFLTLLLIPTICLAQDKMTPDLLWKLGRVSGTSISPDGKWVLYGISYYDISANKGNRDLYLISTAGGESKKITSFKGSEFNEFWKPDGKAIGFLSGENGSVQLWEVNLDGTNAHAVTSIENGINSFLYASNGNDILYTQDVKTEKSIADKYSDLPKAQAFATDDLMYRHWDTWHDNAYSHVFHLNSLTKTSTDLMAGESFDSPLNPFGGIEQITFSNDGKAIIYTCKKKNGLEAAKSTNSDLYFYNVESKKTINLTEGMMGYDVNPSYSPDGKWIAFQSMKRDGFEADKNDLVLIEASTGKKKNTTESVDITINSFVWSADSKNIYMIVPTEGTEQIHEFNLASGKIRQVTKGDHDYTGFGVFGTFLIGTKTTMNNPAEIYKVDIKTGKETQLTFVNKDIYAKLKIGKIEKRWIKTTDNKKMLTWVIYPPEFDASKKYPTLLYCQGGPQSTLSQIFSYRWNFQLMAANGYIIVAPCRRGMPSFGQKWNDQISEDWGGQVINDYYSAIDSISKEPFVNKEKLGAVGASYGGYSVYQMAGTHNKRFKAFISHCGLFNLESWYGTTEELFFANWETGGPYWESKRPKSYDSFSPHKFVQNWDTPILVIHDEKDFRVPFNQGMEAFQAAKIKGIPARFLSFPNENHWILSPQNSLLWQREFFDWLDKWLK
jgi:dipeptidyl aminopeptidase/acylaminoacyl peptidase